MLDSWRGIDRGIISSRWYSIWVLFTPGLLLYTNALFYTFRWIKKNGSLPEAKQTTLSWPGLQSTTEEDRHKAVCRGKGRPLVNATLWCLAKHC